MKKKQINTRKLAYYLADVFTTDYFCGNTLAVFTDAEGVADETMQSIARELNFSECAFVCGNDSPTTYRVRIFAPTLELPFAGHPTIGTAHVLAAKGVLKLEEGDNLFLFKEGIGDVRISITVRDGEPDYCQFTSVAPEFGKSIALDDLAAIVGVRPGDICQERFSIAAVSCGVPFHLVPVKTRAALQNMQFDYVNYQMWLADSWAKSVCVYFVEEDNRKVHARVFSPSFGFLEDPATGAAAASLGAYLAEKEERNNGIFRWEISQGEDMKRPSRLLVEATKGPGLLKPIIRVSGQTVIVGEGTLTVPV